MPPRVLVLVGPTASGKTAVSLEVARLLGAEILSADSRQVYRFMDIGTAKPTIEERGGFPHHLIDVLDPDSKTIDMLMRLNLPAGVDIEIKI